ncbi:MAG: PQQ-binding-like beta-propeller repeat protein [Thermogemmata sp.]|nr:PQQ-binding-like beta-propeller repeat protein [Thermogemmata sp.]
MESPRSWYVLAGLGIACSVLVILISGKFVANQPKASQAAETTSLEVSKLEVAVNSHALVSPQLAETASPESLDNNSGGNKLQTPENDNPTAATSHAEQKNKTDNKKLLVENATAVLGKEITSQVQEINSPKYRQPPQQFRPGHARRKNVDSGIVTKTENGFVIKLPSNAPIPTPTVYKDKLYVSGGFRSREYYCFDAQTGRPIWAVDLSDDGPSSAVCSDGIVVFNTESCTLFALNAETGEHVWSYWLGDPLTSTPAISNGIVYTSYPCGGHSPELPPNVGGASGKLLPNASHALIALELKTGKILWQRWLDSDVMSAPVVVGDEVYVTSFAGTVYRFHKKDGTILSAHAARATSAPVVIDQNILVTQRVTETTTNAVAEQIVGQNQLNKKESIVAAKRVAPYLDANVQTRAALNSLGKSMDAANGFASGAPEAANPGAALQNIGQAGVFTMQSFQGSRILPYQGLLLSSMGDTLTCVDSRSGQERWRLQVQGDLKKEGGHLAAPPVAVGGQIFLATLGGEIWQVDPQNGKVVQRYRVGAPIRSQPIISRGRIYVGTMNGQLVCVDTGDPKFTGWYAWGANMAHTNIPDKE